MTDNTRLTIEELLVKKSCLPKSGERQHIINQLIATMHREAKLLEALLRADTELRKLGRSESNNTRIFIKQVLSCEYPVVSDEKEFLHED